jgi:hypothetical protein
MESVKNERTRESTVEDKIMYLCKSISKLRYCFVSFWLLCGLCLSLVRVRSVAADGPITPQALEAFSDVELAQQFAEEHVAGATVAVVQEDGLALSVKGGD